MSNTGTASMGGGASGPHTVDTDTFAEAVTAVAEGVDSFGNAYAVGDPIITFPDGTTACIKKFAARVFLDEEGNPYPAGPIKVPVNPLNDARVENDALCIEFCDGTTRGFDISERVAAGVVGGLTAVDASTPDGTIVKQISYNLSLTGKCPKAVCITADFGLGVSQLGDGSINFAAFYSIDGNMNDFAMTNHGQSSVQTTSLSGEHESDWKATRILTPGVVYPIVVTLIKDSIAGTPGEVTVAQGSSATRYHIMRQC